MSGCLLAGSVCASSYTAEPPDLPGSHFTSLENGVPHPTTGCGGAVVLTPQPGTDFADPLGSVPASATSFYAKAASLHVKWASTLNCTRTGITHRLVPAPSGSPRYEGVNAEYESGNWSGYDIVESAQYAQAGWTIPTVVNLPSGQRYSTTGYSSSTWVGMGGGSPSMALPLIQAGSTQNLSAANVASYYFWFEIVGGSSDTGTEMAFSPSPIAHPGDDVGADVIWQPSGNATLGICDFTDAAPPLDCVQMSFVCSVQHPEDCTQQPGGNTVEWIVEAPTINYVVAPLADFGEVNFYNGCWATTYTAGSPVQCNPISDPGVTSPNSIYLNQKVFGTYQTLAAPRGFTSGSSFTDTYTIPNNH